MRNMNKQQGFSLIELVMVIILLGIIAVVISKMYATTLTAAQTEQNVTDALSQGRIGIERMARDMRVVRSAGDISVMTSGEFSFTDMGGNSIDYKLTGSSLMRNSQALADGVNTLTFSY